MIAQKDSTIVGIAIENNCILVSNNTKHLDRVHNLVLEPRL
jgi:predicted nucleic acid-binding protein